MMQIKTIGHHSPNGAKTCKHILPTKATNATLSEGLRAQLQPRKNMKKHEKTFNKNINHIEPTLSNTDMLYHVVKFDFGLHRLSWYNCSLLTCCILFLCIVGDYFA